MASARIIRQNFFKSPEIADDFTIEERYFLIGLSCAADDWGRFWLNSKSIQSEIFPTDEDIDIEWIKDILNKFVEKEILCMYEVNGRDYAHFPKWFVKGWYLKQKIDHPRDYGVPDCPICQTEAKKRENSRPIKDNGTQSNTAKPKVGQLNLKEINAQLASIEYSKTMREKYPFITTIIYKERLDEYLNWTDRNNAFDCDHEREFEKLLLGENSRRENENKTNGDD